MLELAIILPVVFALIAAIIDFGFKLNTIKDIGNATRHSARVAASHARTFRINNGLAVAPCGGPFNGICNKGANESILDNDSVTTAARKAACNYLKSTSLNLPQWNVSTTVVNKTEDGLTLPLIAVNIKRIGDDCFICYDRIFAFFKTQSQNRFVLEEQCQ